MRGMLSSLALGLALASGPVSAAQAASNGQKPNFIVILADDFGWKDAGFRGSRYYETPNLDRLANESVEFTRAYACPSCVPSRAALLTGLYSPRTGVFMVGRSDRGEKSRQRLIPVPNRQDLPPDSPTIAKTLRAAGYRTALMGKWHLGNGAEGPGKAGFDINLAGFDGGNPPTYFSPYGISTITDGPPGEYLTDRLALEAVDFLKSHREKPFFLYLPHYAVHVPIEVKPEDVEPFRSKPSDGLQQSPEYAAMVVSLDRAVGKVLDELNRSGLANNTYVVFTSDNGGLIGQTGQEPLREGKAWLYEGGVRVPLLVRPPGGTARRVCEEPVHLVDLHASVREWAGLSGEAAPALDGLSLASMVRGDTVRLDRDGVYWHFPGYQPRANGFRITPSSMVVDRQWKLIEGFEKGELELYDLVNDPSERRNLAKEMPEKAAELKDRLATWRTRTGAIIPDKPNPAFVQSPKPTNPP